VRSWDDLLLSITDAMIIRQLMILAIVDIRINSRNAMRDSLALQCLL
jgi:hypothetical protein